LIKSTVRNRGDSKALSDTGTALNTGNVTSASLSTDDGRFLRLRLVKSKLDGRKVVTSGVTSLIASPGNETPVGRPGTAGKTGKIGPGAAESSLETTVGSAAENWSRSSKATPGLASSRSMGRLSVDATTGNFSGRCGILAGRLPRLLAKLSVGCLSRAMGDGWLL